MTRLYSLLSIYCLVRTSFSSSAKYFNHLDDDLLETFDWDSLDPLHKLRYTPCYGDFECARLSVPLDWSDKSNPNEVQIAVARLRAKVNGSSASFGGTIVLNPGGPGGSGVDLLRWAGRSIQEIVDGEKRFEILSFDPRGNHYTAPSSACFDDDTDRDLYLSDSVAVGSVDDSQLSLNIRWAYAQGLGQLCEHSTQGVYPDGSNIRQYVSTALVARDMVAITDAVEEERYHLVPPNESEEPQHVLKHKKKHKQPLLNYWGYSYGSYLGNTFASMFPDRVGRMILDGVVDAPDYTATGWTTNLQDNDKVWLKFFEWCYEAGSTCDLYSSEMKSSSDIASKLDDFLEHLDNNPIPIVYNDNIYLFTYFAMQSQLHFASYGPWQVWPLLASGLAALLQGDPTSLVALTDSLHSQSLFSPLYSHQPLLSPFNNRTAPYPPGYRRSLEASISILCGDGADITSHTKSDYYNYLQLLKSQSKLIGPSWAQITLWCRHWPSSQRPSDKHRFTGPFASQLSQRADDERVSPLLFIGNTADPVTPVRNAFAMAEQHEGARVLMQDAPGHCSGVNIPSRCTWNVVREYFNEGRLPEHGSVCGVDWKPWDEPERE